MTFSNDGNLPHDVIRLPCRYLSISAPYQDLADYIIFTILCCDLDLCPQVASREVDLTDLEDRSLPDEDLLKRLKSLPGIGPLLRSQHAAASGQVQPHSLRH